MRLLILPVSFLALLAAFWLTSQSIVGTKLLELQLHIEKDVIQNFEISSRLLQLHLRDFFSRRDDITREMQHHVLAANVLNEVDEASLEVPWEHHLGLSIINAVRLLSFKPLIDFWQERDLFLILKYAFYLERNRRIKWAALEYTDFLQYYPDQSASSVAFALLHQAYCYVLLGEADKAQSNAIRVIEAFPTSHYSQTALVILHFLSERNRKAHMIARKNLSSLEKARAYYTIGAYETANQLYGQEVWVNLPSMDMYNYARTKEERGFMSDAVKDYRYLIEKRSDKKIAKLANRRLALIGYLYGGRPQNKEYAHTKAKTLQDSEVIEEIRRTALSLPSSAVAYESGRIQAVKEQIHLRKKAGSATKPFFFLAPQDASAIQAGRIKLTTQGPKKEEPAEHFRNNIAAFALAALLQDINEQTGSSLPFPEADPEVARTGLLYRPEGSKKEDEDFDALEWLASALGIGLGAAQGSQAAPSLLDRLVDFFASFFGFGSSQTSQSKAASSAGKAASTKKKVRAAGTKKKDLRAARAKKKALQEARAKRRRALQEARAKRRRALQEARAKRRRALQEARAKRRRTLQEARAKRRQDGMRIAQGLQNWDSSFASPHLSIPAAPASLPESLRRSGVALTGAFAGALPKLKIQDRDIERIKTTKDRAYLLVQTKQGQTFWGERIEYTRGYLQIFRDGLVYLLNPKQLLLVRALKTSQTSKDGDDYFFLLKHSGADKPIILHSFKAGDAASFEHEGKRIYYDTIESLRLLEL